MTIEAKIITDSLSSNGSRLTTFVLKYPRFIHSELMTHRVFSRNASSSRAIPIKKQIEMLEQDPALPIDFRKNQKGMQAGSSLEGQEQELAKGHWLAAMQHAIEAAKLLSDMGVHKQYANRLLEPFSHIHVVCSSTTYSNFFALRHHSAAQPEIAALAKNMFEAYETSTPKKAYLGDAHLPFISEEEIAEHIEQNGPVPNNPALILFKDVSKHINYWKPLIKKSVARCARVSYLNHEGKKPSEEEDFKLFDRLLNTAPIHASPAEHVAISMLEQVQSGNFVGWTQYRKTLANENITEFKEPLG